MRKLNLNVQSKDIEFLRLEEINYVRNKINNRKVLIWGAWDKGKIIYNQLNQLGIQVYGFIDNGNKKSYCNSKVYSEKILYNNKNKYYIFLSIIHHDTVLEKLNDMGYQDSKDYYYFFQKSSEICYAINYMDFKNNIIEGKIENFKVVFFGINSKLKIGRNNFINKYAKISLRENSYAEISDKVIVNSKAHMEVYDGSSIYIEKNAIIGEEVKIIAKENSCIIIKENCKIQPYTIIEVSDNSKLVFDSECKIGKNVDIKVHNKSIISIDSNSEIANECNMYCIDQSEIMIDKNVKVYLRGIIRCGDFGKIIIGDSCILDEYCNIQAAGKLSIGEKTTFSHNVDIRVANNTNISFGMDCMISYYVTIRSDDGHSIYDMKNEIKKENNKKSNNIIIEDSVWIGMNSSILYNTKIGKGSIVGSNSVVKNEYENNCIIAGNPAKVIQMNIAWSRDNKMTYKEYYDKIESNKL